MHFVQQSNLETTTTITWGPRNF